MTIKTITQWSSTRQIRVKELVFATLLENLARVNIYCITLQEYGHCGRHVSLVLGGQISSIETAVYLLIISLIELSVY